MRFLAMTIVLGLLVTGCATSGGDGNGGEGTTVDVSIADFAFDPSAITVNVGTTVRWTNNESGPIPHTVTSGDPGDTDAGSVFDSGTINPGDEPFTFTFNDPGVFVYHCDFHETQMFGATVTVQAP